MPPLSKIQKSVLALALGNVVAAPTQAATISVGADCSLIEAIQSANSDAVVGLCTTGSGADTIVLTNTEISYSSSFNSTPAALPEITSEITIQGDAAGGSIISRDSSAPDFRLLTVQIDGNLTLSDVTIQGGEATERGGAVAVYSGTLTLTGSTLTSNAALAPNNTDSAEGGAIWGEYATVSVTQESEISDNSAQLGGGISLNESSLVLSNSSIDANVALRRYGGVYSLQPSYLSMTSVTVSQNTAIGAVGGLAVMSDGNTDPIQIIDSTFSNNRALGNDSEGVGGGVYVYLQALNITDSVFSGNYARTGGGAIYAKGYGAELTISGGSISQNSTSMYVDSSMQAAGIGGAICITDVYSATLMNTTISDNSSGRGGGLVIEGTDTTIESSTFSGNSSVLSGGGVHHTEGSVYVLTSTFSQNKVGSMESGSALVFGTGSISLVASTFYENTGANSVSGNFAPYIANTVIAGSSGDDCSFSGSQVNAANNWFEDATCSGTANGIPKLNPLMDNNAGLPGLTLTHAPALSSPLLGAGDPSVCANPMFDTDQRGAPRATCDIGAVAGGIEGEFDREDCFVVKAANGNVAVFCL